MTRKPRTPDPAVEARRQTLHRRIEALIAEGAAGRPVAAARDALLLELLRWQAGQVAPFAAWLRTRRFDPSGAVAQDLAAWPGLPTDFFRYQRVAAHDPDLDVRRFLTSGTTSGRRGAHPFRTLSLYEASARAAAERFLFPEGERLRIVALVPSSEEAPDSSLSFMVDRFVAWFGRGEAVRVMEDGRLRADRLAEACARAERDGEPLALLGTTFAFLYAEEALGTRRFRLPPGSRVMPTGGGKGRTREVRPAELLELLEARYGVPADHVVGEYGMTELSSQAYEPTLRAALEGRTTRAPRRFVAPPWVRLEVVDPETLRPLPPGSEGLVRIGDPANLDSVALVQTLDLGRATEDGVVLLGRAPGAVARGCSLAVEETLQDAAWPDGSP